MKPLGRQLIAEFIYCSQGILNDRKALEQALKQGIRESGLSLVNMTGKKFNPLGVTLIAVISESHIAIHTYPEARHASIDIFTCGSGSKAVYHIDKLLLSKRTKYQQLDIIDNSSFGRMMFLDKDLQIAESDIEAYDSAMVLPVIERRNKLDSVAILGGGDGGVLREVLKYKPKSAYLVEIDKEVIEAAKKYMPGVCKKAFANRRTNVVIDDASRFLDEKHGFDAIIYDLTMHPEAIMNVNRTAFLNQIFSRVKNNLHKNGVVSMQCCAEFDTETLKLLKKMLPKYFKNIVFRTSFIPSFCENWIFASAVVKSR